jgi:hypothetical protein
MIRQHPQISVNSEYPEQQYLKLRNCFKEGRNKGYTNPCSHCRRVQNRNVIAYHNTIIPESRLIASKACRAQSAKVLASSLIPQTLEEMAVDTEHQQLQESLKRRGQAALTRDEKRKRQRSLEAIDAPAFHSLCQVSISRSPLIRTTPSAYGLHPPWSSLRVAPFLVQAASGYKTPPSPFLSGLYPYGCFTPHERIKLVAPATDGGPVKLLGSAAFCCGSEPQNSKSTAANSMNTSCLEMR